MRNNEGIFKEMNAVIYFSCSGQSKTVAEDLAARLGCNLYETRNTNGKIFDSVAVVFPVHCQSYPVPLRNFFKSLDAKRVTIIATYGRANCGNALYEAAKLIKGEIIAGAYLPAKHTYCEAGETVSVPEEIIRKMNAPSPVRIPKLRKTPFAGLLPSARSRLIIKIKKTKKCVNCGICAGQCPMGAIKNGKTSSKCIRCLKCVSNCPQGALVVKKSFILRQYLSKPRFEKTLIYV